MYPSNYHPLFSNTSILAGCRPHFLDYNQIEEKNAIFLQVKKSRHFCLQ
jgi:hypothetical protein